MREINGKTYIEKEPHDMQELLEIVEVLRPEELETRVELEYPTISCLIHDIRGDQGDW